MLLQDEKTVVVSRANAPKLTYAQMLQRKAAMNEAAAAASAETNKDKDTNATSPPSNGLTLRCFSVSLLKAERPCERALLVLQAADEFSFCLCADFLIAKFSSKTMGTFNTVPTNQDVTLCGVVFNRCNNCIWQIVFTQKTV